MGSGGFVCEVSLDGEKSLFEEGERTLPDKHNKNKKQKKTKNKKTKKQKTKNKKQKTKNTKQIIASNNNSCHKEHFFRSVILPRNSECVGKLEVIKLNCTKFDFV